jgi:hypothetical protein
MPQSLFVGANDKMEMLQRKRKQDMKITRLWIKKTINLKNMLPRLFI